MIPAIPLLSTELLQFPPPASAADELDGLLAIGGDLSPQRLMLAYRSGIFPWFNEDDPILWWSPKMRGVLYLDQFYINRSFSKFLRKNPFRLSINKAFASVIVQCSTVYRKGAGTWITGEMINAYLQLHQQGDAHSIEVWEDQQLVGGLYGVVVGGCFCGESMFHLKPYASRVAYWGLVQWLKQHHGHFIDCQMQNNFLKTLGVTEIPRELYLTQLSQAQQLNFSAEVWTPQYIDNLSTIIN